MSTNEQLNSGPNLLEKISPVLNQARLLSGDRVAQFEVVRSWFEEHPENLASDASDLALVCTLPYEERSLFTYPLVGNWIMEQMAKFTPESAHQQEVYVKLREQVAFGRFVNHHWDESIISLEEQHRRLDELNALMLKDFNGSLSIRKLMRKTIIQSADEVRKLPQNSDYTTDLGHGLIGPMDSFWFLTTWWFDQTIQEEHVEPLGVSIMVVDDQKPKEWYGRMVGAGFKDIPGQQGYFSDCESALEALRRGQYDVILTDLDLGAGKMDGIEFAKLAYEIQQAKGIPPRVSVFSWSKELLEEAERRIGRWGREQPILFHQADFNDKARFTGFNFRKQVANKLEDEARFG